MTFIGIEVYQLPRIHLVLQRKRLLIVGWVRVAFKISEDRLTDWAFDGLIALREQRSLALPALLRLCLTRADAAGRFRALEDLYGLVGVRVPTVDFLFLFGGECEGCREIKK